MNREEKKRFAIYCFCWLFSYLLVICVADLFFHGLSDLGYRILLIAWFALAPIGGTPLTRWRLRRHMTWRQIRDIRAGKLPMDIRCGVQLTPGERCFYATGARRIFQSDEIYNAKPLYGMLYITNLRVIFVRKWYGAEFLASEVRACAVERKKVIIQTVNNYVFVVSRPKDVVSMIERMRSHGSTGIVDMIFNHEDGQSETPDEPIPVKL